MSQMLKVFTLNGQEIGSISFQEIDKYKQFLAALCEKHRCQVKDLQVKFAIRGE